MLPSGATPAPVASDTCTSNHVSPRDSSSPRPRPGTAGNSSKVGCSYHKADDSRQGRHTRGRAGTPVLSSADRRQDRDSSQKSKRKFSQVRFNQDKDSFAGGRGSDTTVPGHSSGEMGDGGPGPRGPTRPDLWRRWLEGTKSAVRRKTLLR